MKTSPSPCQLNEDDVLKLEKTLDYHFVNRGLLLRALTHSSYANEYGLESAHNERQEFLGDAVLELCVSWELYKRFPNTREGDLTRLRSSLVNTTSFACRAREIGLDKMLFLGRGEESQGGRKRDSVLSDVFEAVLAAVYEDGGYAAAQHSVATVFSRIWPEDPHEGKKEQDHKTCLQERVQHLFAGDRPVYSQVSVTGPSHARLFTMEVRLPDGRCFTAEGTSCKKAEQAAAAMALEALDGQGS